MGFIDFGSVEEATKALKSMQGEQVDGREVKLDFANQRGDSKIFKFETIFKVFFRTKSV